MKAVAEVWAMILHRKYILLCIIISLLEPVKYHILHAHGMTAPSLVISS